MGIRPVVVKAERLRKVDTQRGSATSRIHKLPINLPEDLYCYVVEVGLHSMKSGGKRLSQTAVIRAALRALAETNLDLTALSDENDLKNRIVSAIKSRKRP